MLMPLEELLKSEGSHYKLVLLAAQRANEIVRGNPPLVVSKSKKPGIVALEEIAKGKVRLEESKAKKS